MINNIVREPLGASIFGSRPAVLASAALALGVLWAEARPFPMLVPLLLSGAGIALLVLASRLGIRRSGLLLILYANCFVIGAARTWWTWPHPITLADGDVDATVREIRTFEPDAESIAARPGEDEDRGYVILDTSAGALRVSFIGKPPDAEIGDRVRATVSSIRPLPGPTNPGQGDFRRALRARGIGTIGKLERLTVTEHRTTLSSYILRARQGLRQMLFKRLSHDTAAFIAALVLGFDEAVSREVRNDLVSTGTVHLLVISGGHFVLVCWFVWRVILRLIRRQRLRIVVAASWVALYACLTGLDAPVIRSVIMSLCGFSSEWLHRRRDGLSTLCLAAAVMLLVNPLDLFSISFQLTFAAAFGLVLLSQPTKGYMLEALTTSLSAWLATLPILAANFHLFSPVTLLANLALGPLMAVAIFLGFAVLVIGPAAPLVECIFSVVRWTAHAMASLPCSSLNIAIPSTTWVVGYFLVLGLWRTFGFRMWLLAVLILWFIAPGALPPRRERLLVLDVGAGSSALLEHGGYRILFDAGSNTSPNVGRSTLVPALLAERILRIDALVLSHPDLDHINGARDVIDVFRPVRLLINPYFEGTSEGRALVEYARSKGVDVQRVRTGRLGDFELFGPPVWERYGEVPSTNDGSLVMRIATSSGPILLPGDIQKKAIDILLLSSENLDASVLVVPHHGRSTLNHATFAKRTRPRLSIVSGRAGEYSTEVVEELRRWGPVRITGLEGAVWVEW